MTKNFHKLLQSVPAITLIAVVAMFFAPFMQVIQAEQAGNDFLLIGMGLSSQGIQFEGLEFAVNLQLILLSILAMSSFFVLLSKGRVKLFFLVTSVFTITIFPVWLMAFSEGLIRPQISTPVDIHYSVAWVLLAIALLGTTYSILQMREEEYLRPVARHNKILDV